MTTLGMRLQSQLEDMEVELDAISVVGSPECQPIGSQGGRHPSPYLPELSFVDKRNTIMTDKR